jgi:hypothetical protein
MNAVVIAENFDQHKFGQAWIKGNLTIKKSRKVLTAISAQFLKVLGKFLLNLISFLNDQAVCLDVTF